MPTVPNWIPRAVIYTTESYGRRHTVIPTTGYRPTKTQVIVTCEGRRGPVERRFRLDDLVEVGASRMTGPRLLADDDPAVLTALANDRREAAITRARAAMSRELAARAEAAETITAIRDDLAKALADLEPLL